jgi:DNA-binding transcriptional ArsR family regulator
MARPKVSFESDPARAAEVAETVKALGHPLRLGIVSILSKRDARVGELCEFLSARQAAISQQLRILRMSGLVAVAKDNGAPRYTLARPGVRDLLQCLAGCERRAAGKPAKGKGGSK